MLVHLCCNETFAVLPGSTHDLTAARTHGISDPLTSWAIACYADAAHRIHSNEADAWQLYERWAARVNSVTGDPLRVIAALGYIFTVELKMLGRFCLDDPWRRRFANVVFLSIFVVLFGLGAQSARVAVHMT
ncbi:hypothetical protein ACFFWA_40955 [Actinomadura verrucosospora]|uniref:hypothetical protein n=1 Tax=Actinomadura verrucosospora TaxID=46165 RepID=UPI0031E97614